MIALLLSIVLIAQGGGLPVADMGSIEGVVRTAAGQPVAGVRVAAMTQPEDSSISLAQTDERGRYRLENIPPGSYYIAAGKVSLPTFYPGSLDMVKGKAIAVTAKAALVNIDIVMDAASVRPPDNAVDLSAIAGLTLPLQVRMEGDEKQPVFANGKAVLLRFTRKQDGAVSDTPLNAPFMNLAAPNSLPGFEYRITVENLPNGYVVKSMSQDNVDLLNDTLKISAKNFVQAPIPVIGLSSPGALLGLKTGQMAYGAGGPMTPLEITLAGRASNPAAGVRVSGRISAGGNWDLALPGSSVMLFADRSFECRGVAPGRHVLLLQDSSVSPSRVLAASLVVGNKDLDDIMVDETVVLPAEIQFPAKTPAPGTIVPLASIRGKVADDRSKDPVLGGSVTLVGRTRATFPIDSEGVFEIPRLLPGAYELTIEGSRHALTRQNVVVGDEDVHLDVLVSLS